MGGATQQVEMLTLALRGSELISATQVCSVLGTLRYPWDPWVLVILFIVRQRLFLD